MLLICSAEERVVGFLHEMARRTVKNAAIELPMSRQDIADYLGLTIETVSRTLTKLKDKGILKLPRPQEVVLAAGYDLAAASEGDA